MQPTLPPSAEKLAERIRDLALGFASLGISSGDRVALMSESRPEWVVADLAIMSIGAITVPAYTTNTVEDHRHILGNSLARVFVQSSQELGTSFAKSQ